MLLWLRSDRIIVNLCAFRLLGDWLLKTLELSGVWVGTPKNQNQQEMRQHTEKLANQKLVLEGSNKLTRKWQFAISPRSRFCRLSRNGELSNSTCNSCHPACFLGWLTLSFPSQLRCHPSDKIPCLHYLLSLQPEAFYPFTCLLHALYLLPYLLYFTCFPY